MLFYTRPFTLCLCFKHFFIRAASQNSFLPCAQATDGPLGETEAVGAEWVSLVREDHSRTAKASRVNPDRICNLSLGSFTLQMMGLENTAQCRVRVRSETDPQERDAGCQGRGEGGTGRSEGTEL